MNNENKTTFKTTHIHKLMFVKELEVNKTLPTQEH